jgi:hypothetical protein
VAETIDWATALTALDKKSLDPDSVAETIGILLKYQDDVVRIDRPAAERILADVETELSAAE